MVDAQAHWQCVSNHQQALSCLVTKNDILDHNAMVLKGILVAIVIDNSMTVITNVTDTRQKKNRYDVTCLSSELTNLLITPLALCYPELKQALLKLLL
jgi:hypothetical protein